MSSNILSVMIGISTFLGLLGLGALIWGIRSGQFNDEKRFLEGALRDGEDELNDLAELEKRKKKGKDSKRGYRPPD
jgi:cbb3-type cytochrome oxidase maturation protein